MEEEKRKLLFDIASPPHPATSSRASPTAAGLAATTILSSKWKTTLLDMVYAHLAEYGLVLSLDASTVADLDDDENDDSNGDHRSARSPIIAPTGGGGLKGLLERITPVTLASSEACVRKNSLSVTGVQQIQGTHWWEIWYPPAGQWQWVMGGATKLGSLGGEYERAVWRVFDLLERMPCLLFDDDREDDRNTFKPSGGSLFHTGGLFFELRFLSKLVSRPGTTADVSRSQPAFRLAIAAYMRLVETFLTNIHFGTQPEAQGPSPQSSSSGYESLPHSSSRYSTPIASRKWARELVSSAMPHIASGQSHIASRDHHHNGQSESTPVIKLDRRLRDFVRFAKVAAKAAIPGSTNCGDSESAANSSDSPYLVNPFLSDSNGKEEGQRCYPPVDMAFTTRDVFDSWIGVLSHLYRSIPGVYKCQIFHIYIFRSPLY